ncbi:hypothetical protein [Streptomyces sp. NPDC015131]|uniref:hypothetical protein n=1 Tax=Streptomyces sp. NPDC015131 TaxID=3364941 RepID=UPI0036FEF814
MIEYTISLVSGDDWPALPRGTYVSVLQPQSLSCERADGDGDHCFRTGATLVCASWELAGTWYVCIEGAPSFAAADPIVAQMAHQLGQAAGQPAGYHRISG